MICGVTLVRPQARFFEGLDALPMTVSVAVAEGPVATKLGQQQCGDASVPLIASSWVLEC